MTPGSAGRGPKPGPGIAVEDVRLAGDDARAAGGGVTALAVARVHHRRRPRDVLAGVERHVERAAAVGVLDAVERGRRLVEDAGREMDAADEPHRARGRS